MNPKSEPILNVPPIVVATLVLLALVHARSLVFSQDEDLDFLLKFAFIPARYDSTLLAGASFPGGVGAEVWTFVTYAFIHADLVHIGVNAVWLLAFGSAIARRFGAARYALFFAATAAAGAGMHLLTHAGELFPMVGASAAISGFMAGSMRFAFQTGGPLGLWPRGEAEAYRVPAVPLAAALRDPRILAFLAAWFGVNLVFGIGAVTIPGAAQSIAWQAHVGGFIAGLVFFAAFDPVVTRPDVDDHGGRDIEPTLH